MLGHTDMRHGMRGLVLEVQKGRSRDAFAGDVYLPLIASAERPLENNSVLRDDQLRNGRGRDKPKSSRPCFAQQALATFAAGITITPS